MGTFQLTQVVEEERILICDGLFYHPGERTGRACGNLLKIKTTSDADGNVLQFIVVQEYDTSITLTDDSYLWIETVHHGACLTSRQRRPSSVRRRYTYGPVNAKNVTFVHCKQCEKRFAWKKFKKVEL